MVKGKPGVKVPLYWFYYSGEKYLEIRIKAKRKPSEHTVPKRGIGKHMSEKIKVWNNAEEQHAKSN